MRETGKYFFIFFKEIDWFLSLVLGKNSFQLNNLFLKGT